ncbi:helicase SRCAP isoform X3 [Sebastes umbrosus]|uniref:helicase SRCAP isoform X3 n=1 Tax=Sebastes umbrosus TaxID=72105 RepID=UPI00189CEC7D|nr:helicase SRCAP isoform X3 [Sebastes umbrosus]
MENAPQTNLPETLPIRSDSKDSISEKVHAEESVAEVVGVSRSLPTSLNEDCSSSAEMQRLPAPLCPPLAPDTQIDSTVQELQYGSQTDKEKSHSNSKTNQIQPPRGGAGLVVITGTKEKQSVTLEYKPETGTNTELGGKEHTGGNILLKPRSQICFTASSPSVPQSSVSFKVQDATEHGAMEPSDRDPLILANQGSHIPPPGAAVQAGGHQDSKSSPLPLPSSGNSEIKQTDLSKPQTIKEISTDVREIQKENSLESVEHVKELVDTSHKERQLPSADILDTPKARESPPGLFTSAGKGSSATSREDGNIQRSCDPLEGEQVESSVREEQTDTSSSDVTMLPECSSSQESSSKPSAAPHLFDTSLVVSLQTEQVAEAETSHPPDQVPTTETPLTAELVHSAEAQEIVVVREEAHISGDWSNMHLNQSYLLQREDGSVCEAAIVNELSSELSTGEPKLYEESVQADIELHSQPVEVYEFCTLVEEVAEETVCASSSAQIPHSPGYEVNLFNALLDHTDVYTVKVDLETTIHTINESDTVFISQQPLPSSHDANQTQASSDSHNLSTQNTKSAAVGQHLVLDANQAVEVDNSSEVCLVEVAAVTSDSFAVEQMDTSPQIVTPCSQVNAALLDQTEVSDSPVVEMIPPKQEAGATAGALSLISPVVTGEDTGMESSVAVSVQPSLNQTVVSATKREACVSSPHEGTKETPALTETPSQSVQNVAVPTETKPKAICITRSSGIINPKLLLLKPGETPLLKHPPSLLAKVSKQQNAAGELANAHSSRSGTASEECLPQTVSDSLCASVALSGQKDQTQCSVNKTSVSAAPPGEVRQPTMSGNSLQLDQTASVTLTTSTNKSDKEALNVTKTSSEAESLSQDGVAPTDATKPNALYVLSASGEREDAVMASTSQPDSLYVEEESEDMEQDEATGETEAQEATSGQVSSPEEGSDEEPDADKTESEMTTPSSTNKHGQSRTDRKAVFLKVRQWIADRVTANSSPVSPSTSSSCPGPSQAGDWSALRRDKSSPLRGPHGKFVSPGTTGGYSSTSSPPEQPAPPRPRGERHTDMAELAKHEADIEHRTQTLRREGFWSTKRLTRLTEPPRPKVHWDYLCEEMQWLSADFAQERRWKRGVARKVVRMVMRHHEDLRQKEEKAKRDEHSKIRRVASSIAKEVRAFWSSVEKVVQYKQQSRLEEKRKKALDLQLDFIVGQTEKYSDLLSKSLAPSRPAEPEPEPVPQTPNKSVPSATDEDDRDFEPPCEEEDDEATIEVEEQQEGNDAESHRREIELLKEEGMLPLDQLLSTLKLPQESGSDEECSDETSSSVEEEDGEFTANEEDAEDEEDTIADQEKVEGNVNHAEELDDLAKEGDMSVEELLEKYKGAYASDYEAPSASGSKESSDSEVSGDEEEETEEDESDVESNTSSSDSAGDSGEDDDSEKDEESEEEDDGCGDEGMEVLLKEGDNSPPPASSRPKKEISHIAATAESLQPKGYTLATTKVKTPIPFLLHGQLREYQHIGLDWLVTMYEKKLNGILADEMGLGKTIQTIALLAHLACEKGNWGPHLIIVPTSVMLNWEMELKRWCPGFKILTYFGSQKERKLKRQGWTKPNAFHVCITSYKLVLQDHQAFRRKSWRYLILDEAQNIKNFKSQRWQSLLNFNSHRRLLLTGTPLQNSLMELWSLMHFLMPHVFQSHREFKEWFSNPLTGMIEGSQEYNEGLVKRLHKVLRPFLLRRIKIDVEKQMPKKYEHVVRCRLSKRQRFLYDDFMAQATTRETLASGHFMSVINILMQLRKVCNHPNLFDPRPIQSPFITKPIVFHTASLVQDALEVSPMKRCDLSMFDLVGLESRVSRYQADVFLPRHKVSRQLIQEIVESPEPPPRPKPVRMKVNRMFQPPPKSDNRSVLLINKPTCSVPPAAQTPKPPPVTEVTSTPAPAPVVHQVVCSVATTAAPRPAMHPTAQTAVRSSAPKPVLTVRPPTASCTGSIPVHTSPNPGNILPQRVLLSPDMQARLPSGEVVSIAQLASLAGRPVSSCQGSKPVTFQLQGNKLTLSGAQIHQVPAASPRPVQANVMHLVSSGVQHHLITTPAQVTVTSSTSTAPPTNRLPHNVSAQVVPAMVSSPGVVKIVVRQTAGKDGGTVPTLAVAPSPRVVPLTSPSLHPHAITTPVRSTAPLQIVQRTPGPATVHYTIAPPGNPSPTPNQPHPPRPVLKVVQPPPSSAEQPAPVPVTSSASASKSSAAPRDSSSSSSQTPVTTKSRPSTGTKAFPPPRRVPRPPPRSPFHVSWLADSLKQQRDSRLDFIIGVNENRCAAKPMYGREVLDFLTFLPGPRPSPAALSSKGEWGRSGHSSALFAQWQDKYDYWFQSRAVRKAIHSMDDRLELLNEMIDRFTFAIPPVEAPPISMHCCHPPPSLSHQQAVFSSLLSTQVTPLTRSLHRIQCYMRTQFPDLRLIQYDCGKLQTLHTLLRKLKTGGHRVLIFTQMTRMLDVLEQFLNYHGHIYLRLDGSTRVEMRQSLMERFNADRRIFCFILSTRSGGVGVNLTGADTVVFYDSDWNPTMDAQAQDRCHRIGQTRDVHIYRLISERTVEENILKKANQKRMLGDMAIEGGNFTTAFFKQQTIRDLFDMNEGERREVAVELSVPQAEEAEEAGNKTSTTILEQALCRAEDEEDIVAASQAKAEQVAELAEFNENIPLDEGGEQEEVEELSKAEQEIAALVEQLTPIERYAMNFLEASLEDVCKEELKQAEEQVEAARKGLDQAKEEGLKLHASSDDDADDFLSPPASVEPPQPARRGRKPKDKDKIVTSTRTSGRLRGASPEAEPDPTPTREVPERLRCGLRGRGAAKDTVSTTPSRTDQQKTSSSTKLQDSSKSSKASSPARDHQTIKTRTLPNRSHSSPVPSPPTTSPPGGKQQQVGETDGKTSKACKEENERRTSESPLESSCPVDHQAKDDDHSAMSPPSTSSRSPRKRQSADGEVLRGLVEDSPSAKVLRKLPGRLVTVVEEKEPKRRRRRGSGTGGGASSEEATIEENTAEEPNKDNASPSADSKTKGTATKSPQDQDSTPSPSVNPPPVRSYPPYSPPHHSPDMPVLRNLPVRRRLETESRMAAQLGEQHLGRGRGGNQSRKTDTPPGKDTTSTESGVNSLVTPLKRKRGRPPKTPPRLSDHDKTGAPPPKPTSTNEAGNPPQSPKRKRGRPRKEPITTPETVSEGQNSKKETTTPGVSGVSKTDASIKPTVQPPLKAAAVTTSQASQSKKAEDTKTEVSAPAPNPAQAPKTTPTPTPTTTKPPPTTTDKASTPVAASVQTPTAPLPLVASTSASVVSSAPATVPSPDAASTQVSSASSVTLSKPAVIPITATPTTTTPSPPANTVTSTRTGVKLVVSTASKAPIEPKPSVSTTVKTTTGPAKTTTVATPAARTPSTVSSSAAAVKAAPASVPATTITTATDVISKTVSVAPAVTTTVKSVTTKTTAGKDLPQASAPSSTTSTQAAVTSTPAIITSALSSTTSTPAAVTSTPAIVTSTLSSTTSTPASVTSTPVSVTSTPAVVTSTAASITSAVSSTTSTPAAVTSTAAIITSAVSSTTSTPAAVTSTPAAVRSTRAAVTSTTAIVTSAVSSTTSTAVAVTSATAIITSALSSTCTPAAVTSTPAAVTSTAAIITSAMSSTSTPAAVTSIPAAVTSTPAAVTSTPAAVNSTPAIVTSSPAATQKVSATASPKPTSTSSPATATTVTTTVKTVLASPSSAVPTASSTTSASATPSVTTVSSSAANTSPPARARTNVTTTKVATKSVSTSPPTTTTVKVAKQATVVPVAGTSSAKTPAAPTPTCTPSPSTTSASVTTTAQAKTVTVTTTEGVQVVTPVAAAAAPSKEHTTTPATTAEKTVNISPPVTTSTGATPAPSPTASSPERSITVATTNVVTTTQVSITTATPVSTVAATTAATTRTVPPVSTTQSSVSTDVSKPAQTESPPRVPTSASSSVSSEKQSIEPTQKVSAPKSDPDRVTEMEVDAVEAGARTSKEEDEKKEDVCKPKRRKVESSSETKESGREEAQPAPQKEERKQEAAEPTPIQKRPLSRQSSQDSARSSSSSSGCSTSTLTRHAHHKRTYENRHPAKKMRMDDNSETGEEEKNEEGGEKEEEEGATSRGRRSRSSSSSSDSDNSESRKERRLTRSAKHGLKDEERKKGNARQGKKPARSSDKNASNNANASTGGESGSDTSSVRIHRKSAGSQPSQERKAQTNSAPPLPPEPEVLGKRCSALNAAAKLLAMKGRVDTPGHTTRRDSGAKAAGTSPASSSDKNQKSKSKSVPASPQSNSVTLTNNKSSGSKPSTPNQTSRPASRSTRQCPGPLVPPLEVEVEYKRSKPEDKERGSRKSSRGKEGEAEAQSSSRGHSACSSMSSDGEGNGRGRSSRSRSSSSNSNSSQRTHSISSQYTEHRESRAASSGSERDRSSEGSRDKRHTRGQRRESRRSQKHSQEVTGGSGTEGTPDRVLRSVAALAAVQARSPALSTRSSSGQHRHHKT